MKFTISYVLKKIHFIVVKLIKNFRNEAISFIYIFVAQTKRKRTFKCH